MSKIYFLEIGGRGGAPALRDDSLAVSHVRITTTTACAYQIEFYEINYIYIHGFKLTGLTPTNSGVFFPAFVARPQ